MDDLQPGRRERRAHVVLPRREDAAADEPLDFKTIKLQYNVQAKFVLE